MYCCCTFKWPSIYRGAGQFPALPFKSLSDKKVEDILDFLAWKDFNSDNRNPQANFIIEDNHFQSLNKAFK